jgi:hypothetical protein
MDYLDIYDRSLKGFNIKSSTAITKNFIFAQQQHNYKERTNIFFEIGDEEYYWSLGYGIVLSKEKFAHNSNYIITHFINLNLALTVNKLVKILYEHIVNNTNQHTIGLALQIKINENLDYLLSYKSNNFIILELVYNANINSFIRIGIKNRFKLDKIFFIKLTSR